MFFGACSYGEQYSSQTHIRIAVSESYNEKQVTFTCIPWSAQTLKFSA